MTKVKERTMMMAILASLGMVLMPLGDFVGGQIYKAGLILHSSIFSADTNFSRRLLPSLLHILESDISWNILPLANT